VLKNILSLLPFDKGTKGKYAKDDVTDLSAKQTMVYRRFFSNVQQFIIFNIKSTLSNKKREKPNSNQLVLVVIIEFK
jgi:hypothetical protein